MVVTDVAMNSMTALIFTGRLIFHASKHSALSVYLCIAIWSTLYKKLPTANAYGHWTGLPHHIRTIHMIMTLCAPVLASNSKMKKAAHVSILLIDPWWATL